MRIIKPRIGKDTKFETPYYIIKGSSKGNAVMLTAGVHGNEIASILSAKKIIGFIAKRKAPHQQWDVDYCSNCQSERL